MGFFDTESQRRNENIERCRIIPAAETVPDIFAGGRTALAERISELKERAIHKAGKHDVSKLAETLGEDIDKLLNARVLSSADRYMGIIYLDMTTALDYISGDAIVILDQRQKSQNGRRPIQSSSERI
jgi:transcription-repair coupling factor (superfamily II helicase)